MNRNSQQPPRPSVNGNSNVSSNATTISPVKKNVDKGGEVPPHASKWYRSTAIIFLFAVTILAVAAVAIIGLTNTNTNSSKYVNSNEMQAVFVNVNGTTGGQVYFGHIQSLNSNYVRLTGVFFIQQSSSSTSATQKTSGNSLVLQKLGCQQIHDPEDQMIINNSQVLFWENLSNDGQVAKQAAQYYKNNPSGTCSSSSTSDSSTSNSSANNSSSANSTANTNGTSTTTGDNSTSTNTNANSSNTNQ